LIYIRPFQLAGIFLYHLSLNVKAGADVVIMGRAIFSAANPKSFVSSLLDVHKD
jgi:orotidine-5'-phosphate decarboxylase